MTYANLGTVSRFYPDNVVIIDTETTGLKKDNDEVLSLSVVDVHGNVLFDHLVKPQHRKRWPSAEKIHGISPADVAGEKAIVEYSEELGGYFDGSFLVVGYNVGFDVGMLSASGLDVGGAPTFDVMREAEKVNGRRLKLTECATAFGYGSFEAHGSLEDAKATAYCFERLVSDDGYKRICELEEEGLPRNSARIVASQQANQNDSGFGIILVGLVAALAAFILVAVFACGAFFG